MEKRGQPAAPVHQGRLLQGKREIPDESLKQPDGEWNRKGCIGKHQGARRVQKPNLPHDGIKGYHQQHGRKHIVGQENAHQQLPSPKLVPGKCIGSQEGHAQ